MMATEMSVELTDCVSTVDADPDLVRYVVYKKVHPKVLSRLSLARTGPSPDRFSKVSSEFVWACNEEIMRSERTRTDANAITDTVADAYC